MSTFGKPSTSRQLRHPGARSRDHGIDKIEGERRKETTWLPIPAANYGTERNHGLESYEYILDHAARKLRRCKGPEEFSDFVEAEAAKRNWFNDLVPREGHTTPQKMRRKVKKPIARLTTTFTPWLSDWAYWSKISVDPTPDLKRIRTAFINTTVKLLDRERHVLPTSKSNISTRR